MIYDSFAIVEKLDDRDNNLVKSISKLIREKCKSISLPEKDSHNMIVFSVGGDGTMLHAVKQYAGVGYVVGINLGKIGFLTDIEATSPDDSDYFGYSIYEILNSSESYVYDNSSNRLMLNTRGKIALNEFTLSGYKSDSMITYELYVNGRKSGEHRANSVIVSTPTGSTAYSLSAGGSIMMPEMDAIQIVPVAPLGLTSRPIIVSGDSKIVINILDCDNITLRGDGQYMDFNAGKHLNKFTFEKSSVYGKILHNKHWNFFETLQYKMNWRD